MSRKVLDAARAITRAWDQKRGATDDELYQLKVAVEELDDLLMEHERHAGDWHEWSAVTARPSDAAGVKPARLFVRVDDGSLIEICEAEVTSDTRTARELSEGKSTRLFLTNALAEWLLRVLPLAYREKNR